MHHTKITTTTSLPAAPRREMCSSADIGRWEHDIDNFTMIHLPLSIASVAPRIMWDACGTVKRDRWEVPTSLFDVVTLPCGRARESHENTKVLLPSELAFGQMTESEWVGPGTEHTEYYVPITREAQLFMQNLLQSRLQLSAHMTLCRRLIQ